MLAGYTCVTHSVSILISYENAILFETEDRYLYSCIVNQITITLTINIRVKLIFG